MINIVIPMAGEGSRFVKEGFQKPKPFIDVAGKPMICRVMENINIPNAKFYLIARQSHLDREPEIVETIKNSYDVTFIGIDKLTEGTACTVLFAKKYIDNDTPLLIANSDQIVDCELSNLVNNCLDSKFDGSILTFDEKTRNKKWSFAKLDDNGFVIEVKEKEPISDFATVGIYFYSKGKYFVDSAIEMIINNDRVNNEFYTCPVYNYLIKDNKKIITMNIGVNEMHGLGTPEDLSTTIKIKGW